MFTQSPLVIRKWLYWPPLLRRESHAPFEFTLRFKRLMHQPLVLEPSAKPFRGCWRSQPSRASQDAVEWRTHLGQTLTDECGEMSPPFHLHLGAPGRDHSSGSLHSHLRLAFSQIFSKLLRGIMLALVAETSATISANRLQMMVLFIGFLRLTLWGSGARAFSSEASSSLAP